MSRSLFVLIITELRGCCISKMLRFLSRVAVADDAREFLMQPLVMDRATFSGSEYKWAFGTNHALPSCDSSSKRSKRADMMRPSFSIRSCTAWVARASCLSSFLLACFVFQKVCAHWTIERCNGGSRALSYVSLAADLGRHLALGLGSLLPWRSLSKALAIPLLVATRRSYALSTIYKRYLRCLFVLAQTWLLDVTAYASYLWYVISSFKAWLLRAASFLRWVWWCTSGMYELWGKRKRLLNVVMWHCHVGGRLPCSNGSDACECYTCYGLDYWRKNFGRTSYCPLFLVHQRYRWFTMTRDDLPGATHVYTTTGPMQRGKQI